MKSPILAVSRNKIIQNSRNIKNGINNLIHIWDRLHNIEPQTERIYNAPSTELPLLLTPPFSISGTPPLSPQHLNLNTHAFLIPHFPISLKVSSCPKSVLLSSYEENAESSANTV